MRVLILFLCSCHCLAGAIPQKILLCGVGKNVQGTLSHALCAMEELGSHFSDYAILLYENNSTDRTPLILQAAAERNPKIVFLSETLTGKQISPARTERIARARNAVLALARRSEYRDFRYLLMADLDFDTPWPIEAILETINSEREWDCVAANGISPDGIYCDRYAFRGESSPLGPELLGDLWWSELPPSHFRLAEEEHWIPVYSAFGGLAIYKTESILPFAYSGVVTEELRQYYRQIVLGLSLQSYPLQQYCKQSLRKKFTDIAQIPIQFRTNTHWEHPPYFRTPTCCEHVPLHASMALHGFGKLYVNPKMVFRY